MTTVTQEIICGPCDFREIVKPAVVWCPTCDEGLCDECSGHHRAAKATRGHKLINSDHCKEMPRKMIEEFKKCSEHDERYELFCPNHEIHCCVQCVKEKHENCTGITLLNKVIENIKSSAMVSTITHQLEKRMEGLTKLKKNRTENIDRIEKQSSGLCTDFRRMRKEMDLVLDEFENTLNEQATLVRKTQSSIVNDTIAQIGSHESIYKEMHTALQKVLAYGSEFQVYSAIKKIEEKIMNEDKETKLFFKNNNGLQEINVALECSQQLSSLLSKDVFLATVKTSNSTLECDLKILDNLEAQKLSSTARTTVSELKFKQCVHTHKAMYNVSSKGNINISSIVPLPTGQTVITDYGGPNGILLFNSYGKLITSFTDLGTPHGACLISDSIVAVSFPMIQHIILFEISGPTILIKKSLLSYQTCFGLSFNSDGNILAATRSPVDGIFVIDLNGHILKRVNLGLSRINYVHCYENNLIVTELESKEILVYNLDGKKIKRFTFDDEPDLRNVCVDKHGNIFVIALKARKVTVISEKDDRRHDLMGPGDGFRNPKAIAYNPKNGTIIVADKDGQCSAFYDIIYIK